ncbi:substrate-binding domain-containing protein [Roseibium sp.]|uniref:substrate-binding domain-containing protein n=1 Tax=Roseibium sp. TaxID=1936156 RepID=UPI003A980B27
MFFKTSLSVFAFLLLSHGVVEARDRILIVGSSTVFPFSIAVAETFGEKTGSKTPVVESTGSGGGIKLFCAGTGDQTPDITNASRPMKADEKAGCEENGVTPIEVVIGYDGIVLANSRSGPSFELTREQVFLALSRSIPVEGLTGPNGFESWSEIDATLPNEKIEVFGPPPTSGTRDAFEELVMEVGCKASGMPDEASCSDIRRDGAYIEAGENDDLIVGKLEANPMTVGIFGFSFLDQNMEKIQGASIEGVEPTFANIASGSYPVSRPLYFYVKKEHLGKIPGLEGYLAEFSDEAAWGDEGYLLQKGLIPLSREMRATVRARLSEYVADGR